MNLTATYCAKSKHASPELLPAHKRYISHRIALAHASALAHSNKFAILSGSFGLIHGDHPIPHYDHLLQEAEISTMVTKVANTLKGWGISHITWHSLPDDLDPYVWRYRAVITRAADIAGCKLDTVELLEE